MSNSPEDNTYAYHFLTRFPARYLRRPLYVDMFRGFVERWANGHPNFADDLRKAALSAIGDEDVELIRRCLQCLAHVGLPEDIPAIKALSEHPNPAIVADAKTCIHEIAAHPRLFRTR